MSGTPSFTIGIEEEYLLIDQATGELASNPPVELIDRLRADTGGRVHREFLRCQIEVATGVHASVAAAGRELGELRARVAERARQHGLAIIASATHPRADWTGTMPTDTERHALLAEQLQGVGRRLLVGGMHIHVGIEDPELRLDLMNQATYFAPHLLALSTSSPYWRGRDTGLASHRLAVLRALPRTGIPELFDSHGEYLRFLERMIGAGLIDEPSKLWWDLRLSARYPTLELRAPDVCPLLDDALAIAALYQALLRMLWRLRRANQRWRLYPRALIEENRWRAMRFGPSAGLVDFGKGAILPFADLLDELLDGLLTEDLAALGSTVEAAGARHILARGTSAERQRAAYREAVAAGLDHDAALARVIALVRAETLAHMYGDPSDRETPP